MPPTVACAICHGPQNTIHHRTHSGIGMMEFNARGLTPGSGPYAEGGKSLCAKSTTFARCVN